ncbi:MAG TPA: thiamine phosphate synthase, partial [Armatimonadetes bacterium]|nr:thiamine phosphate synthase [Armatimonadota bacterium]
MHQASVNYCAAVGGIYIITDRYVNPARDHVTIAQLALDGGAHIIQLRDKHATTRELIEWGWKLRCLTRQYDKLLIINGRVDVALAVDADGVHLGDDDMPLPLARKLLGDDKIIGRSVDNVEQACCA